MERKSFRHLETEKRILKGFETQVYFPNLIAKNWHFFLFISDFLNVK